MNKKIIIKRIIIYSLAFIYFLIISLYNGSKYNKSKDEYLLDMVSLLENNGFKKSSCDNCNKNELSYINDDSKINISYEVSEYYKVYTNHINARFELRYNEDIKEKYSIIKGLYNDEDYTNIINRLLIQYKENGIKQQYQINNKDKVLTIYIDDSEKGKDYIFYYSVYLYK